VRVLSFEPVAANFHRLQHVTRDVPQIECLPLALGDKQETATMALAADSQGHSLSGHGEIGEQVTVTTLDAAMHAHAIARVDFLKIDVEGHELAVLRGAHKALEERRIGPILTEATLWPEDRCHTQLAALQTALAAYGYRLGGIYDQDIAPATGLNFFNALFVR
jgi:FkbM family methyltransferase